MGFGMTSNLFTSSQTFFSSPIAEIFSLFAYTVVSVIIQCHNYNVMIPLYTESQEFDLCKTVPV